ncbi:MAG: histidine ammonia-lyase [Candidatus Diapherotrites archaeon]
MKGIEINGSSLTVEKLAMIARFKEKIFVSRETLARLDENWKMLNELIEKGETIYGVNTGFGGFGDKIISKELGAEISKRTTRSHAAGVMNPLPEEIVRAAMACRINTLAKGCSGIRSTTLQTMIEMLNKNVVPVVYEKGSLGASGDLAPLAMMALVVMGEGEAFYKGKRMPGAKAMKAAGIKPIDMRRREGLALFNGSQLMTGIGALAVYDAGILLKTADISASMSIDVLKTVMKAFDERLHALRPFKGQNDVAANIRALTAESEILAQKGKGTQSAYSLRCTPQVHGASRDALEYAKKIVEIEMNSVADNPIFITKDKAFLTGGNFHGQPVAIAMDLLGIAIAEIANISERRINRMTSPHLNAGLPGFLVIGEEGLDSGLMMIHYSAASLVSENKVLAHPASVDSIPVSGDQEDHVSMGTIAARKCREIINNAWGVLTIELMCAAQALDIRRPLRGGIGTEAAYREIRKHIGKYSDSSDAVYSYFDKLFPAVVNGEILQAVERKLKLK